MLETKRLLISKITLDDAPFFLELLNSPNFIKYIGDKKLSTIKGVENYLENGILKSYQVHGFSYYKLQLQSNPEKTIGITGILKRKELEHPDVGFSMLPEYEGKGYGYESSVAVMQYGKDKFNINTICAITLPNNKNSINLIEKLGLVYEKTVKPFADDEELLLFAKTL